MNTTELEERLRSAYRARTDLVTPARLTDAAPDFDAPARTGQAHRRSWVAPLLAAAAVVLLAVAAAFIARVAGHDTRPANEPLRFTPPRVKMWDGVSAGWTVAVTTRSSTSAAGTVYLLDPAGHRTRVASVSASYIRDIRWSDDHSRIALELSNDGNSQQVETIDLRTHTEAKFAMPVHGQFLGFAAPDGSTQAILLGSRVRVVDPSGAVRSTRPATSADVYPADAFGQSVIAASVNGRPVVISGGKGRALTIDDLAGHRITTLLGPERGCAPDKPWSRRSLLVRCGSGFWELSLDGGPAVRLARPDPGIVLRDGTRDLPYGLFDLYRVSGQLYGGEVESCGGNEAIARIGADQLPHRVPARVGGLPTSGGITGVTDTAFYYLTVTGGCSSPVTTLYSYAPAQHRVTKLLGGTILAALTLGASGR